MSSQPPVPDNEAARLAKLHALMVLDSAAEDAFDNLVRLASAVCGVPIALISLIDEGRQWFKAQTGLPGVTETPRDQAFCAHAIMGDALFEVADASVDARFSNNPLVTGQPDIRFYAGAPLTLPTGERIGTLCVIDRAPRKLNAEQSQTLSALAQVATSMLVMRRDLIQRALAARSQYEAVLTVSESQHRSIVEEQTELISLASPDGRLIYVNPAYARHFGKQPAEMLGASLYDYIQAADQAIVRDRIDWVMNTGQALKAENRMCAADGTEIWVAWTNSVQTRGDGSKLLRSVGQDVSARKRAELALRASESFLQRTGRLAGVGGWELDLLQGALVWSEQTRRIHEVPEHYQPTLEGAIAFYAAEARPRIEAAVRNATETGQGWDLELPFVTFTGRPIWVRAVGEVELHEGQAVRLVGAFQDITSRKQLEQQIADGERFVLQVTDNLPIRMAYLDRDARYRFVNRAHCDRFHRSRADILGRTRAELTGADESAFAARVAAVLAGTAQRFEFDENNGTGVRRIESRLMPDLAADGTVKGFFATGVDITERSQAEQALRVLTTIVEVSTDFVVQADGRGNIEYMNPAARRIVGLAPDAPVAGRNITEFNTPQTNRLFTSTIMPAVKQQGVWQGETTILAAGGASLPVSHLVIAHRDANGRIERYSAVMRDISVEVAARAQRLLQTATLRSVTEALPAIVSAVDLQLRYRFVNSAFERWHGLVREQILGRSALDLLSPEEVEGSKPWALRALAGETVQFERQYPSRPGQPTLAVSYIPLRLDDGTLDGFVGVALDITPHRQEQIRLQDLAHRDPLTGLLNRAGFAAHLSLSVQHGEGPELALLAIDLDHFKPVNDSYGHPTGDRLLQAFAQRVVKLVRPTDACARLGGDEFAVLLHGVRDLAGAEAVAAKVLDAAHMPFDVDGRALHIGASLGVALGAGDDPGGSALMARADAQLYRAKHSGRGRQASEAVLA